MTNYILCANTRCDNPVRKLGDLCEVCKLKESEKEYDEKAERQAAYEHKKKGKGK